MFSCDQTERICITCTYLNLNRDCWDLNYEEGCSIYDIFVTSN